MWHHLSATTAIVTVEARTGKGIFLKATPTFKSRRRNGFTMQGKCTARKLTVVRELGLTSLTSSAYAVHPLLSWALQIVIDSAFFTLQSDVCPPKTITVSDQEVVNPSNKVWYRQDNLIRNALMASVDPFLASSIAAATTSKQAWDQLHTTFANKSQMRIYSLRDLLGKVSHDSKTISEYLREIRSIADELASAGSPISNEELVVKSPSGLGTEFREISAAIRARNTPIPYEELSDNFLHHELFLKHEELKKHPAPITAQAAQRTGSNNSNFFRMASTT
ncbi:hypothetical protein RJ639_015483 [Escallonia herrerae]|uniref:Gag protein n=1 Tax=Escallonia herrerae TaxID=1293975 RepID=A0AA88VG42_9ASTE|nr:hypothetical protein RJ639_015483 [Escallonia herrerae]